MNIIPAKKHVCFVQKGNEFTITTWIYLQQDVLSNYQ